MLNDGMPATGHRMENIFLYGVNHHAGAGDNKQPGKD